MSLNAGRYEAALLPGVTVGGKPVYATRCGARIIGTREDGKRADRSIGVPVGITEDGVPIYGVKPCTRVPNQQHLLPGRYTSGLIDDVLVGNRRLHFVVCNGCCFWPSTLYLGITVFGATPFSGGCMPYSYGYSRAVPLRYNLVTRLWESEVDRGWRFKFGDWEDIRWKKCLLRSSVCCKMALRFYCNDALVETFRMCDNPEHDGPEPIMPCSCRSEFSRPLVFGKIESRWFIGFTHTFIPGSLGWNFLRSPCCPVQFQPGQTYTDISFIIVANQNALSIPVFCDCPFTEENPVGRFAATQIVDFSTDNPELPGSATFPVWFSGGEFPAGGFPFTGVGATWFGSVDLGSGRFISAFLMRRPGFGGGEWGIIDDAAQIIQWQAEFPSCVPPNPVYYRWQDFSGYNYSLECSVRES